MPSATGPLANETPGDCPSVGISEAGCNPELTGPTLYCSFLKAFMMLWKGPLSLGMFGMRLNQHALSCVVLTIPC